MHFEITRDGFQALIDDAARVIPSRTTLPVLANVLIRAKNGDKGGRVLVTGTDLDRSVMATEEADVQETGAITVPARKLKQLVGELPEAPVKFSTNGDRAEIECGQASFVLFGLPADEFPTQPEINFSEGWSVTGKQLRTLIDRTAFAASSDESRPILQGVLWELRGERMNMVATNGHRLAQASVEGEQEQAGPEADFILPTKALQDASRLFDDADELIVSRSENYIGFRSQKRASFTRLIEGPYPNYSQVIPNSQDTFARVDAKQLRDVVKRMAVVASEQTHRVRIHFGNGQARFSVKTPDLGEAEDQLAIEFEGEPLEVAFNASYLDEVLGKMPDGDVRIGMTEPEQAVTLRSAEDPEAYLSLIMPLRMME